MKPVTLLLAAVCFAFAACADDPPIDANGDGIADGDPRAPDSVTLVAPSSPKGRVTGRLVASDGRPLPGVEVQATGASSAKVATDASGLWALEGIAGNATVGLIFNLAGHAPAWATATVPGSAGDFPLNGGEAFVGPLGLLAVDGSVRFEVVGWDGAPVAKPAGMMEVTPGFLDFSRGSLAGRGSVAVQAAGNAGALEFTGVPKVDQLARLRAQGLEAFYSAYFLPVLDEAGRPRYAGQTVTLSSTTLLVEPWARRIVLGKPGASKPLQIEATNITNLVQTISPGRMNLIAPGGPIYLVFNQRVAAGNGLFVEVRNDNPDAATSVPLQVEARTTGIGAQLMIMPKADATLSPGQKYNLVVQVYSLDDPSAAPLKANAPFFGGDPTMPQGHGAVVARFLDRPQAGNPSQFDPGEVFEVIFDRYIGRGETGAFSLPVYFEYDLNGSDPTKIGDSHGEKGSGRPICLPAIEDMPPVTGAKRSGYARRFSTAGSAPIPLSGPIAQPTLVRVVIALGEASRCGGTLQTVWGDLLTDQREMDIGMSAAP